MSSYFWYGGSGSLNDLSNWMGATQLPGAGDDAFFPAANGSISGSGSYFRASLAGNIQLTGSIQAGTFFLGFSQSAILTIQSGGRVAATTGVIATGNPGSLTITGASASASFNELIVANTGVGTLNLLSGGSLSVGTLINIAAQGTANGTVIVDGANSQFGASTGLIGQIGSGTLIVRNGATASLETGIVGNEAGSHGSLVVTGTDSAIGVTSLTIGVAGTGSVSASNNGRLYTDTFVLGVGYLGTTQIESGAMVFARSATFGLYASGEGYATITGAGSALAISEDLIVGNSGTAGISIQAAGSLLVNGDVSIGHAGGVGSVEINGSGSRLTVNDTRAIMIGYGGDGGLLIQNQSEASSGALLVGVNGTGSLTIRDAGTLQTKTVIIGQTAGGAGGVAVSGTDSFLGDSGDLVVGGLGSGGLVIEAGAGVGVNGAVGIGHQSGGVGSVRVSGLGSNLTINDAKAITLGFAGDGGLLIENQGEVSAGALVVGVDGSGSVTVTGGGSLLTNHLAVGANASGTGGVTIDGAETTLGIGGNAHLGVSGKGSLVIQNGAAAALTGTVVVGDQANSEGLLLVDGEHSFLSISGDLVVGRQGVASVLIDNSAHINVAGKVLGTGTVSLGALGTLEIGSSSNVVIDLSGNTASLKLNAPGNFGGFIAHFGVDDTVNLAGVTVVGTPFYDGASILRLNTSTGNSIILQVRDVPANTVFFVSKDGAGGTNLTAQLWQTEDYLKSAFAKAITVTNANPYTEPAKFLQEAWGQLVFSYRGEHDVLSTNVAARDAERYIIGAIANLPVDYSSFQSFYASIDFARAELWAPFYEALKEYPLIAQYLQTDPGIPVSAPGGLEALAAGGAAGDDGSWRQYLPAQLAPESFSSSPLSSLENSSLMSALSLGQDTIYVLTATPFTSTFALSTDHTYLVQGVRAVPADTGGALIFDLKGGKVALSDSGDHFFSSLAKQVSLADGNDLAVVTTAGAVVQGGAGDDWIVLGDNGGSADGGKGRDLLIGGAGADTLTDGSGKTFAYGGAGDDFIRTGADADSLEGGPGSDTLLGGDGPDAYLYGNSGDGGDTIFGFASSDRLGFSRAGFELPEGYSLTVGINFIQGPSPRPTGNVPTFLLDRGNNLLFDPDGTGAEAAVLLAHMDGARLSADQLYFY